ncbi:Clp protease [seawater metagenome]|uniref:Clp protease n=1 Tax=seawater metagenome TaxID=1561972 RepID=A0A5E8CJ37_9ZZZZ
MISSKYNHVYFYVRCNRKTCLNLNQKLLYLDSELEDDTNIIIHINSPGGSVTSALSSVDTIMNCKHKVITIVEGIACSAATLISVAGDKRYITPHGFFMIHQLSNEVDGTLARLVDELSNSRLLMKEIIRIYAIQTKLTHKQLQYYINNDLYFTAQKTKELGFVHDIINKPFSDL